MSLTLVSVTETDGCVISRYESGDGFAVTSFAAKTPLPELKQSSPMSRMHSIGAADIHRLETHAATQNDAEELTTAWDQQWSVQH